MKSVIAMSFISILLAFSIGWSMYSVQAAISGNNKKDSKDHTVIRKEVTTTETTTEITTSQHRTNITEFDILDTKPSPVSSFRYNVLDNGIEIYEYIGDEDIVVVPEIIEDLPVISVLDSTFRNHDNLVGISFPNSVPVRSLGIFDRLENLEIAIYNGRVHTFNKHSSGTERKIF